MQSEDAPTRQEAGLPSAGWPAPSSLYIHIPFCPYKCPYCDFATYVGSRGMIEPYVDAICSEIRRSGESQCQPSLQTVYFGGGTPGMLQPCEIGQILDQVDGSFRIRRDAEISLELNPGEVDQEALHGFRALGVNRLSIGAQSFNDDELRALGRRHTAAHIGETVAAIRVAGFDSMSMDLMYGVCEQSSESWSRTLQKAIELEPDHLSLYSLILEPGTPFRRRYERGMLPVPDDDLVADMYHEACRTLCDAGYVHYEVANWSRPGHESRHNSVYWRDEEFFACGVGAYDYIRPYRSVRYRSTKKYVEAIDRGDDAIAARDYVPPQDERFETCIMRLRLLKDGLPRALFSQRFADDLNVQYGPEIRDLVDAGFLTDDGETVRLTEPMVILANEAWERFVPTSPGT